MTDDANLLTIEPIEGGLRLAGEVDLSTIGALRDAVTAAIGGPSPDLVLDLRDCSYLGSEAIGLLIATMKRLAPGTLILRGVNPVLEKVLDLAGVAQLPNLEITPS